MVTIVDPHIKEDNDYYVYKQAKDQGLAVTSNSKDTFVGHCWPGSSIWIDYTNEAARLWWSELFSLAKYKGSSESLFVWNDMNEVF
jgi:alpha 1,3-glucosidase